MCYTFPIGSGGFVSFFIFTNFNIQTLQNNLGHKIADELYFVGK